MSSLRWSLLVLSFDFGKDTDVKIGLSKILTDIKIGISFS